VLYVGGMSAAELFPGVFGAMAPPPPPRILRTINGADWQALPQTAGTLLGDLGKGLPGSQVKVVSFDTLVGHGGRLFATIGDSLGNRAILASSDPTSGDNAWQLASPPPESFPVGALTVYNGFLYCVVSGKPGEPYRVFKADAEGTAPLTFSPVMTGGGDSAESMPAGRGISFAEFKGRLYLGTGTPPELVRIDADDSWELLVGQPRLIDGQLKRPLTGVTPGLGSAFSAQFRSLAVHEGKLYVGTSDWSQALEIEPSLAEIAQLEFSFDLFRSDDGFAWTPVTRNGFGVSHQPIAQTMQSTPAGLFVGGASFREGSRVWQRAALPKPTAAAAPPERLEAVSEELSDDSVVLSWEPSAGAVRYRVYRAPVVPLLDVLSGGVATLSSPQESASVGNLIQGLCDAIPLVCALFTALQSDLGVPGPFTLIGTATDPFFLDERVSALPALYFVRAEDAAGQVSRISNMAGGPSRAALLTFPGLQTWLDAAAQKQASKSRTRISKLFQRAQTAAEAGNLPDSERLLLAAEKGVQQGPLWQRVPATEAQDLTHLLQGLHRNVWLGERELIPLESVLEGLP